MPGSTMCVCGDMQTLVDELPNRTGNVFVPHTDRRTGEPCKGMPLDVPLVPFDESEPEPQAKKKLFATVTNGQVVVAIVPESYYDYVKRKGATEIEVDRKSSIWLKPADFERWLIDVCMWWDEEKAKIGEQ
jgi:hypothetical protein